MNRNLENITASSEKLYKLAVGTNMDPSANTDGREEDANQKLKPGEEKPRSGGLFIKKYRDL